MSEKIHIFEVGPRDGLQNEKASVSLKDKLWLIQSLSKVGLRDIEAGAFVHPERVPQMASSDLICKSLNQKAQRKSKKDQSRYWYLVPNLRGLERALEAQARHIALFTAASETFTQKNIGMSIRQSLNEFQAITHEALVRGVRPLQIRGYVSTAFSCPFEGKIAVKSSMAVIEKLLEMGVDQVSIGDTIGAATPQDVSRLMKPAIEEFGVHRLAVHFHDTRGTALANALRALDLGIRTLDASAGGLGGCPFAPGATGNLATEDLVYMLEGMDFKTGVDLAALAKVSIEFSRRLRKSPVSRYLQSFASHSKGLFQSRSRSLSHSC